MQRESAVGAVGSASLALIVAGVVGLKLASTA
jgi:multidrug transporter EmrE-like cation transporter